MPRLIFTSHYLRDAPPEHLENYVRYIGTREGVEKIDESKLSLLWEENSTVAETAQMVGYRTSQYFSQIFMRNVGMKPQEYKKQRKE